MLIQSPPLIVCLFVWPSARQPAGLISTNGDEDAGDIRSAAPTRKHNIQTGDDIRTWQGELSVRCIKLDRLNGVVVMITMATQQRDRLLPLCAALFWACIGLSASSCHPQMYRCWSSSLCRVSPSLIFLGLISSFAEKLNVPISCSRSCEGEEKPRTCEKW